MHINITPSAPIDATYITQTANGVLTAEQNLAALATGLLKNANGTGVLAIGAAGTDYATTLATVASLSTTTAHQTFALDAGTQVVFEQAGGADIVNIYEASKGVDFSGHIAIGGAAGINESTIILPGTSINAIIMCEEEITDLTSTTFSESISNFIMLHPAANATAPFYGMHAEIQTKVGNTKNFTLVNGVYGSVTHQGEGDIVRAGGLEFYVLNYGPGQITQANALTVGVSQNDSAGGEITTGRGLYVVADYNEPGGVLGTSIGLDIEDIIYGSTNFSIRTFAGNIVFNEGSHNDTDFRVEGATDTHLLFTDGSADRVGINDSTPDGKLDIVQSSTTAAIPVIELEQLDVSEEFFNFVGTVATGNPIEAVGAKTLTTTHFIRVAVNGSFLYFPVGTIA